MHNFYNFYPIFIFPVRNFVIGINGLKGKYTKEDIVCNHNEHHINGKIRVKEKKKM